MKASDAKIGRLGEQLKRSRQEKGLLETEAESLRGEVMILNEMLAKKRNEQKYFDAIYKGLDDNLNSRDAFSKLYEEELEKQANDNEVLLNNLNKLRQENAMLKEQHIIDRQETHMLNCELNDAKDHILALQYQLESRKLKTREDFERALTKQDSSSRCRNSSGFGIERAKSDSTVHGFRTFDSTFEIQNYFGNDSSNDTS